MQRLQTEHLKRQQEHIMQHNIQELQAQMTKSQLSMSGPQSLMFLPFLEQLRLPVQSTMPPPPATSTAPTGNKHINSIANVRIYSYFGSIFINFFLIIYSRKINLYNNALFQYFKSFSSIFIGNKCFVVEFKNVEFYSSFILLLGK